MAKQKKTRPSTGTRPPRLSIDERTATAADALVVRPDVAARLLDVGQTRLYALLNTGELKSFLDGRSRKILVASIRDYVARKAVQVGSGSRAA